MPFFCLNHFSIWVLKDTNFAKNNSPLRCHRQFLISLPVQIAAASNAVIFYLLLNLWKAYKECS